MFQDRVPSVLNGGLSKISPIYGVAVLSIAAMIEVSDAFMANEADRNDGQGEQMTTPGDFGFDPLGLFGKTEEQKKFQQ